VPLELDGNQFVTCSLETFERYGSGHFFLTRLTIQARQPSWPHGNPRIEAGLLSLTDFFLCNKRLLKGYCAIGIVGL
jgi:hypothetical protein